MINTLKAKKIKESNITIISSEIAERVLGGNEDENFRHCIVGIARPAAEIRMGIQETFLFEIKDEGQTDLRVFAIIHIKGTQKYDYKAYCACNDLFPYGNLFEGHIAAGINLIHDFSNSGIKRDMDDIKNHRIGMIEELEVELGAFIDVTGDYSDFFIDENGNERTLGSWKKAEAFLATEEIVEKMSFSATKEDGSKEEVQIDLVEHDRKVVDYLNQLKSLDPTFDNEVIKTIFEIRNKSKSYWPENLRHRIQWDSMDKTPYKGTEIIKFIRCFLFNFKSKGQYKHVGLHSPKGCGKNVLINTASSIFLIPIYEIQGNPFFQKEDMLGDKILSRNQFNQIMITHKLGIYAEAMANNAWVLLDEYNSLRQDVQILLNSATDDRRRLEIPGHGIVRPDDSFPAFMEISTMNVGYQGTVEPNAANMDRKIWIKLSPDNVDIKEILSSKGVSRDSKLINKFDSIYHEIKKAVKENVLEDNAVSIRGFIDALQLTTVGYSPKEALVDCIANKIYDDEFNYKKVVEIITSRFAS